MVHGVIQQISDILVTTRRNVCVCVCVDNFRVPLLLHKLDLLMLCILRADLKEVTTGGPESTTPVDSISTV